MQVHKDVEWSEPKVEGTVQHRHEENGGKKKKGCQYRLLSQFTRYIISFGTFWAPGSIRPISLPYSLSLSACLYFWLKVPEFLRSCTKRTLFFFCIYSTNFFPRYPLPRLIRVYRALAFPFFPTKHQNGISSVCTIFPLYDKGVGLEYC